MNLRGKILLDGQQINKVSHRSLRDKIHCKSRCCTFDDSVENNIKYAKLNATDNEISL